MIVVNNKNAPIFTLAGVEPYAATHPMAMISMEGVTIQEWLAEGRRVEQSVFHDEFDVDDTHRWLVGHNSSAFGGAIRDMWAPECLGDPGSLSSSAYHCGDTDNGGVHVNSGIANRLFALAVDGSEELSMNGLGATKAYHIHYYALENLHTPTSSFAQHGAYLAAACDALVGVALGSFTSPEPSGEIISESDCDELDKAIEATGVLGAIPCVYAVAEEEPLLPEMFEPCDSYTELAYSVDFRATDGNFTLENFGVYPEWVGLDWVWTTERGIMNHSEPAWFAPNPRDLGSCYEGDNQAGVMIMTSPVIPVSLAAGHALGVKFSHVVQTEPNYDGGVVFYSVNGDNATLVPFDFFTTNGYNGYLAGLDFGGDNPLAAVSESAFTGATYDLEYPDPAVSSFVLPDVADGDEVQISFVFGIDSCSGFNGWEVFDVATYSCSSCGDGICATNENCTFCPQDCECSCGDDICEQTFAADDCPADCRGDGVCQDGEFITTDCCGPIEDCFLTNFGDTWTALEPYNSYDPFFTDDEVFRGPDHTGIFFRNDFASYYLEYPSFYSYDDPIAYSGFWTAFTAPPPGMNTTLVVDIFTTCGSTAAFGGISTPDQFLMHLNGVDLLAFDNDTAATNDLCTDPETINYSAPPVYDEIEFDVTDILVPGEISYLVFESLSGYGSVAIDRLRVRVEPTSAPTTTTTTPMPTTTTAMPTSTLIPTTMPTSSTEAPTTAAPVVPDCVDPSDVSQLEGACTEFCEENVCDDTSTFVGLMITGWVVAFIAIFGLVFCAMHSPPSSVSASASASKDAPSAPHADPEAVPMSTQVSAGAPAAASPVPVSSVEASSVAVSSVEASSVAVSSVETSSFAVSSVETSSVAVSSVEASSASGAVSSSPGSSADVSSAFVSSAEGSGSSAGSISGSST